LKPTATFNQRFYELLSSMRFAVSMLTVIAIASIIGTVLQQNKPYPDYILKFGQFWFEIFEKIGLYDVYHALWFLLILLFLVISTSLCVWRNSPNMVKEWRTFKEHAQEKSLRTFELKAEIGISKPLSSAEPLANYLTSQSYTFKTKTQENGDILIAAKTGTYQRLGYILTHAAIIIICLGGLLDGNLLFKVQEMMGIKKIETMEMPESKVPEISRLKATNPSFRALMTLPEGENDNVAFVQMRDGYLVQELPFRIALKDFRIEHYATGQPKSFESDITIIDPDLKAPMTRTISVNHPLIYKGVAIYQSNFEDGGSKLNFRLWDLQNGKAPVQEINGEVFTKGTLGEGIEALTVEFNEFRKFNIINLTPDGKGKPRNVGPNTTYKLRDVSGQAREYVTYMQPMQLDGKFYFISGMRETVGEEFKYLRIPADDDVSVNGFMRFKSVLQDPTNYTQISQTLAGATATKDDKLRAQFEQSITKILTTFAKGGFSAIAKNIEAAVPAADRDKAAATYIKMLQAATFEAYNIAQKNANLKPLSSTPENQVMLQDYLNAYNDMFFYGTPYYLQLDSFKHIEASGLQLTKSPGQFWVYLGSALLVLGVFAMFYVRERRLWLLLKPNEVLMAMSSNRKNLDLDEDFNRTKQQLSQLLA
jgi:cytochrome c biogenesis protein